MQQKEEEERQHGEQTDLLGPLPAAVRAALRGVAGQEQHAVVPGCVVVGVGCIHGVLVLRWRAVAEDVAVVGQPLREVVVEHRT